MKAFDYNLIKHTYSNFKWNFKAVVFFEIVYKLLALVVIVPLNYLILENYIHQAGIYYVTNTDIFRFALTPQGIMSILMILVISFLAIFIEMSVLIYMANKSHQQQSVSLLEGVINCIRILPKRVSLYQVAIVLMTGVIGPLTGIGLYNSMIKRLSIPSFIQLALFKSWQGKILFILVMVGLCLLLIRWILSLPIIIIEEVTLKEAFKKSTTIYKKNRYKLIGYMILWGGVTFLIQLGLLFVYLAIGTGIISILTPFPVVCKGFIGGYLILFLIGSTVLSVMMLPLFIAFLVEIYYAYESQEGKYRVFKDISVYENHKVYQAISHYEGTFKMVILTLFVVMVGMTAIGTISDSVLNKKIAITAHRGSSLKAPENSLSSVRLAIDEEADYAEIDVTLTKDEEVVLFHDASLKRINGSNRMIKDMTLEEIKEVDNGSYFSSAYSQERIPTLGEVLEVAKDKIKLNIELKPMQNGQELARKVAEVIKAYNMEENIVVSSLDYESIQAFRSYLPLVRIGYIMSMGFGDLTRLNVDFISVEYGLLTKELVYAMSVWGTEIHVWTINDPDKVRDVARLRVDNIITDSVEMVQEELKGLEYTKDIDSLTWFYHSIATFNRYLEI